MLQSLLKISVIIYRLYMEVKVNDVPVIKSVCVNEQCL